MKTATMKTAIHFLLLISLDVPSFSYCMGQEKDKTGPLFGKMHHPILAGSTGELVMLDRLGHVTWSFREGVGNVADCWVLENGNVLYADGKTVTEVAVKTKKIVWQYVHSYQKGGAAFGCQRLPGGKTLIGINSENKVIEVDRQGMIVFEMQCRYLDRRGSHNNMRLVRKMENGNYLVCHKHVGKAVEYRPDGTIVREFSDGPDKIVYAALRDPEGNTWCSYLDAIVRYDRQGKETWRFEKSQLPEVNITYMCCFQLLPGGNVAIGNYAANRKGNPGNSMLEISPEGKLVWRYRNPSWPDSTMGVHVMDVEPVVK